MQAAYVRGRDRCMGKQGEVSEDVRKGIKNKNQFKDDMHKIYFYNPVEK